MRTTKEMIQKLQQVLDTLPSCRRSQEINNRILKLKQKHMSTDKKYKKVKIQDTDNQADTIIRYPFEHIVDNDELTNKEGK